jgi:hypothetical protein
MQICDGLSRKQGNFIDSTMARCPCNNAWPSDKVDLRSVLVRSRHKRFAQNLPRTQQTRLSCGHRNTCELGDFLYQSIIGLINLTSWNCVIGHCIFPFDLIDGLIHGGESRRGRSLAGIVDH